MAALGPCAPPLLSAMTSACEGARIEYAGLFSGEVQMKIRTLLSGAYMFVLGAIALPVYAAGALAAGVLAYLAVSAAAGFAWNAYNNHLPLSLAACAAAAGVALFLDYLTRRPRHLRIKTHGLWGAVGFAAICALWVSNAAGGPNNRSLEAMLATFAVAMGIFLWPAVKDLYAVWRASFFPRASRDRSLLAFDGATRSAAELPVPRRSFWKGLVRSSPAPAPREVTYDKQP